MLECHRVTKNFGGLQAVSRLDMVVNEGEIVGLVGPNGSGKSTLINVITGVYEANDGRITFLGEDITREPAHLITNRGIVRTYQVPRPFGTMTVRENVAISCMFGWQNTRLSEAQDEAQRWLAFTDLGKYADQPVGMLNLHQRKFLELARALASRPKLLLLDEVMAGLTPLEIDDSISMIRKIHDSGMTIVIVEHIMKVVRSLSERIVVLNNGSVIAEGPAEQVMQDPDVVKAYLGKEYSA